MTELWKEILLYFNTHISEYFICVRMHIGISLLALFAASVIGIPCGYLCSREFGWSKWIKGGFQVLRIVPSLAVLIFLIPILGVGIRPAITALVLLAVPPILMNTAVGFQEVPDYILETAEAMGMTKKQIICKIRIPLALPMIFAGMKTAMVEIIASATIASKIGAGGLGDIILTGLGLNRSDLLLIGGLSVAVLALASGILFECLELIVLKYRRI